MTYAEYMLSPTWAYKKRKALARYGYKCNRCGRNGKLHVHHKKYPKRFGSEPLAWLEVLCVGCHAEHHKEKLIAHPESAPPDLLMAVVPDWIAKVVKLDTISSRRVDANLQFKCVKCGKIHSPKYICQTS